MWRSLLESASDSKTASTHIMVEPWTRSRPKKAWQSLLTKAWAQTIFSPASNCNARIKMSFRYLDVEALKTLYKAMVCLLLFSVIWSGTRDWNAIETFRCRATRFLETLKGMSYYEILKVIYTRTNQFRGRGKMIEIYKVLNKLRPNFESRVSTVKFKRRWVPRELIVRKARMEVRKQSFTVAAARVAAASDELIALQGRRKPNPWSFEF